jgi:hypothetical protein
MLLLSVQQIVARPKDDSGPTAHGSEMQVHRVLVERLVLSELG